MQSVTLRAAWPALIAFALMFSSPGRAQESKQPSGEAKPTLQAQQEAPLPCDKIPETLRSAPMPMRPAVSRNALRQPCRPMPALVWAALQTGKWEDGQPLNPTDRVNLLGVAVESRYGAAETLVVRTLEEGIWPDSEGISLDEGAALIRTLKPALDDYRTHLLLDIYEQQEAPPVRQAVLETLKDSSLEEALLPAVQAYYEEDGAVQKAGLAILKAQPEKTAPEVLARLIHKLPDGPLLRWAARLGRRHPSEQVAAMMKERGLPQEEPRD